MSPTPNVAHIRRSQPANVAHIRQSRANVASIRQSRANAVHMRQSKPDSSLDFGAHEAEPNSVAGTVTPVVVVILAEPDSTPVAQDDSATQVEPKVAHIRQSKPANVAHKRQSRANVPHSAAERMWHI
jgi:hypothetical protein